MVDPVRHHLLARVGLALTLALLGCAPQPPAASPPPAAPPAPSSAPTLEQEPAVAVATAIATTAHAIVEALPLPPPKPPASTIEPCVSERAIDLIISFEVGDPATYTRKYQRPIWPGAASGATVGLGYDLGYQRASVIAMDWERHPHQVRMQTASGITGPAARKVVQQLADVSVTYGFAREVFDQTSLVEHCRIARRVFGAENFAKISANARGALTSVVFNRGGSMNGSSRIEMREIRDVCLPRADHACIARQILAMMRIWKGGSIENGMRRRRTAEARLAEAP
jgi:GH24 family phage-related lysozyme (muramidase)